MRDSWIDRPKTIEQEIYSTSYIENAGETENAQKHIKEFAARKTITDRVEEQYKPITDQEIEDWFARIRSNNSSASYALDEVKQGLLKVLRFEDPDAGSCLVVEAPFHTFYYNFQGHVHRLSGPAVVTMDGRKYWFIQGLCHRNDGPSIIEEQPNGKDEKFMVRGKLHRDGGPAIIWANGDQEWFQDGQLHREDGPAMEHSNVLAWWQHGLLHRDYEPAVEFSDGRKEWWKDGKKHRLNGPAVESPEGEEWWISGNQMQQKEYEELLPNVRVNQPRRVFSKHAVGERLLARGLERYVRTIYQVSDGRYAFTVSDHEAGLYKYSYQDEDIIITTEKQEIRFGRNGELVYEKDL